MSPQQIDNIVTEAIKQARADMAIIGKRALMWPITKLLSILGISKSFRKDFGVLAKLSRDKFGKEYYAKLLELKGLTGRAPQGITVSGKSADLTVESVIAGGKNCQGGFNPMLNTIEFTKEFPTLSRGQQASLIAHELKHFEQSDTIIRTFGIDRYIQAVKNNMMSTKAAQNKEKTREEIVKIVEDEFKDNNYAQTIRDAFKSSSMGKRIEMNSEEAKLAQRYIEALENYVAPQKKGILLEVSDDYLKNALEVEAYKTGKQVGRRMWLLEQLNINNV